MSRTATRITEAERLRHQCPECHALPGQPCRFYNGTPTDKPHRSRGPGQAERKDRAEADRRNARVRASYGPLFQAVADREVTPETAADVRERRRRDAAFGAESASLTSLANTGIERIYVRWVFREAAALIGEDAAARLWEYAVRVYEWKEAYMIGVVRRALTTTNRIQLRFERRVDPARAKVLTFTHPETGAVTECRLDGSYVACVDAWEPAAPVMTPEEFDRRFPPPDHKRGHASAPEPDDGGLFDRTIGRLGNDPLPPEQPRNLGGAE